MSNGSAIVIGGGVIGLAAARELLHAGWRVTLIERGRIGAAASWAGGGILSPLHPWRYPDALLALAHTSQRLYPAFVERLREESGIDPEWQRSGLLILDGEEISAAKAWGDRWAMPLEVLSGQQLRRCEPALTRDVHSAMFLPDIAQVRNPRLLAALGRSVERLGGKVLQGVEVTGFNCSAGGVDALETDNGAYHADRYLVAAGAWTGQLLAPLGIALAIEPVKGQMVLFRGAPGAVQRIILRGPRYLIPRRDGRILVGSTIERTGFDDSISREARTDLVNAGKALAPVLGRMALEHHWAGLRPGSPRGVPYLGAHPALANLYVAAGHFRNGLMAAPASATLLRQLIAGEPPELDPAPYRLDRDTA